jgi:hypothetical protein
LNKTCSSSYRGRYRVRMSAEELDIQQRISMIRIEYSF